MAPATHRHRDGQRATSEHTAQKCSPAGVSQWIRVPRFAAVPFGSLRLRRCVALHRIVDATLPRARRPRDASFERASVCRVLVPGASSLLPCSPIGMMMLVGSRGGCRRSTARTRGIGARIKWRRTLAHRLPGNSHGECCDADANACLDSASQFHFGLQNNGKHDQRGLLPPPTRRCSGADHGHCRPIGRQRMSVRHCFERRMFLTAFPGPNLRAASGDRKERGTTTQRRRVPASVAR
jgi:hypothetical protein